MVKRSKGIRSKSRQILRKRPRDRGLTTITKTLQQFESGESVDIIIDSSIPKGMPHIRYHGYTGKVVGKQGNCFKISIRDGKKEKILVIRPEHLRRGK
jgi:large subunit ribosomal protein L21e